MKYHAVRDALIDTANTLGLGDLLEHRVFGEAHRFTFDRATIVFRLLADGVTYLSETQEGN